MWIFVLNTAFFDENWNLKVEAALKQVFANLQFDNFFIQEKHHLLIDNFGFKITSILWGQTLELCFIFFLLFYCY